VSAPPFISLASSSDREMHHGLWQVKAWFKQK